LGKALFHDPKLAGVMTDQTDFPNNYVEFYQCYSHNNANVATLQVNINLHNNIEHIAQKIGQCEIVCHPIFKKKGT
jgi:hypothetical protein